LDLRIHIVAIASAILLFALVFELVRRRRLMERYALLWLLCATTLLVLSVWKDLLNLFAKVVGIAYPPNALFLVALAFVLLLLLHFSLVISTLHDQSKVLAQRVGMLQQRLDEVDLAREVDAIDPPAPERELTSPTRET
jgi:hypothetical protein